MKVILGSERMVQLARARKELCEAQAETNKARLKVGDCLEREDKARALMESAHLAIEEATRP